MTLAVDQPHSYRWRHRSEVVTPSGVRATVRPLGAAEVGLLSALVGAWGAIAVFVGPTFGWRPTSADAWQWTTDNWLLHLVPGAVATAAGLLIVGLSLMRRDAPSVRRPLALAALLLVASGAWFILGPAWWPTFRSSPPFAVGTTANMSFVNQLGTSLGPGILLAVLGGMALKASIARPAVAVGEVRAGPATGPVAPMTETPETPVGTSGPAPSEAGARESRPAGDGFSLRPRSAAVDESRSDRVATTEPTDGAATALPESRPAGDTNTLATQEATTDRSRPAPSTSEEQESGRAGEAGPAADH
jgi:hypothetical protein